MTMPKLAKLISFDGEARSGKGTVVRATKESLIKSGYNVMLIDAGQVFRVLVLAVINAGISIDDSDTIDDFLADKKSLDSCVQLVKDVYHMPKHDRELLLYTNEVGENSAKIGARPLSQIFKDKLLKKWLNDATKEGVDVVLLDGRAGKEVGQMLEDLKLCKFIAGLYFVCDPIIGAKRTLNYATIAHSDLNKIQRAEVDSLVQQIIARNLSDRNRVVQAVIPPDGAPIFILPYVGDLIKTNGPAMATIDTSANMNKSEMTLPVVNLIEKILKA